ncbi:unnamed protein product [Porites evermanni]|uniref:SWIM-type domain-containing protein n=1 Tax=Porites evermanni TaxID=104178 RepID=A0ABN8MI78_9CNID|nr:unnamed protein product [Porites evermanni]
MKVPKIAEEEAPVDPRISMKEQLKTGKGDLANPLDNENRKDGSVNSAYCLCKGGADRGCRHIAAALFDLEANVRLNDLQSCTSGQCMWKKRGKRNEGSLPIQDLQTSGSYGVTLKDAIHPRDFNPICIRYNVTGLEQDFKAGLLETCPSSSALPFLSSTKEPRQTEEEVRAFISSDVNVSKEESVQIVHVQRGSTVYSMNDYAKVFLSVNTDKVMPTVSK